MPMWPLSLLTKEMLEWHSRHRDFKAAFKLVNSNISGSIPRTGTKLFIQWTAKLLPGMNLAHFISFSPCMVLGHSVALWALCWRINQLILKYTGYSPSAGFDIYSWVCFIYLMKQNLTLVPKQTSFYAESHRFEENIADDREQESAIDKLQQPERSRQ